MIRAFEILVPDEKIELLHRKIDLTRWPDEVNDERWTLGAKKSYLEGAVETWRNSFDWRKHEAKLNDRRQLQREALRQTYKWQCFFCR